MFPFSMRTGEQDTRASERERCPACEQSGHSLGILGISGHFWAAGHGWALLGIAGHSLGRTQERGEGRGRERRGLPGGKPERQDSCSKCQGLALTWRSLVCLGAAWHGCSAVSDPAESRRGWACRAGAVTRGGPSAGTPRGRQAGAAGQWEALGIRAQTAKSLPSTPPMLLP